MSNDQLLAEQASLQAEDTVFAQQGKGSTSLTRDLRMIQDRLNAIAYVMAERGYVFVPAPKCQPNPKIGITSFEDIQ